MSRVIAKSLILYQNRMYEPGDVLPVMDTKMVDAWLESGTAIKECETKDEGVTNSDTLPLEVNTPEEADTEEVTEEVTEAIEEATEDTEEVTEEVTETTEEATEDTKPEKKPEIGRRRK